MKTLIIAAGALALTATAAVAAPSYDRQGRAVAVETAQDAGYVTAGRDWTERGFQRQDYPNYRATTPNTGAGTSRTSNANQG